MVPHLSRNHNEGDGHSQDGPVVLIVDDLDALSFDIEEGSNTSKEETNSDGHHVVWRSNNSNEDVLND